MLVSSEEMRPIRCIEHPNAKATITPFVGKQIEICEAFGFEIPEGCALEYVVHKTTKEMKAAFAKTNSWPGKRINSTNPLKPSFHIIQMQK